MSFKNGVYDLHVSDNSTIVLSWKEMYCLKQYTSKQGIQTSIDDALKIYGKPILLQSKMHVWYNSNRKIYLTLLYNCYFILWNTMYFIY